MAWLYFQPSADNAVADLPIAESVPEKVTDVVAPTTDNTAAEPEPAQEPQEDQSPFASQADESDVTDSQSVATPTPGVVDQTPRADAQNSPSSTANTAVARQLTNVAGDDNVQDDSDQGQQNPAVVVVPESYPVTDAEKYFIPKEERGPGNLGGPPPLNFPGGPSDPNRTTFEPPPAPGQ